MTERLAVVEEGGHWAILTPSGVFLRYCPCCGQRFETQIKAMLCADALWPTGTPTPTAASLH